MAASRKDQSPIFRLPFSSGGFPFRELTSDMHYRVMAVPPLLGNSCSSLLCRRDQARPDPKDSNSLVACDAMEARDETAPPHALELATMDAPEMIEAWAPGGTCASATSPTVVPYRVTPLVCQDLASVRHGAMVISPHPFSSPILIFFVRT